MKKYYKKIFLIFCILFQYLLFYTNFFHDLFIYNHTNSLPCGIYLKIPYSSINKNDYVVIDIPENVRKLCEERGWLKKDEPLLKKVGGLEGDTFIISDKDFYINNSYIGPIFEVDNQNNPMPKIRGSFTIRQHCFIPYSDYITRSFDGRYFGEIPLSYIKFKVIPLITF